MLSRCAGRGSMAAGAAGELWCRWMSGIWVTMSRCAGEAVWPLRGRGAARGARVFLEPLRPLW